MLNVRYFSWTRELCHRYLCGYFLRQLPHYFQQGVAESRICTHSSQLLSRNMLVVSVICCCVTNHHKLSVLKKITFYYLTISEGQENGHGLVGSLFLCLSQVTRSCPLRLGSPLQAQLGQDLIPSSLVLSEFPGLLTEGLTSSLVLARGPCTVSDHIGLSSRKCIN